MPRPTESLQKLLQVEQQKSQRGIVAPMTEKGYMYDWRLFDRWCKEAGRDPLPATEETVSLFLAAQLSSGKMVTTTMRRTSAISYTHRLHGHPNPVSDEIWSLLKSTQRVRGERPQGMKPLSVSVLKKIIRELDKNRTDRNIRNKAILLVGFASALRRSTLTALLIGDVEFLPQGMVLKIRREKQDQEGKGRLIGIPFGTRKLTCPVHALTAWMKIRGDIPGALFTRLPPDGKHMQPDVIWKIVKAVAKLAEIDIRGLGAHSLRSGLVTAAGEAGAGELQIAAQTGHRSMQVLRQYFRPGAMFRGNVCSRIGL